ncbi:MAG TPA: acyl-CoA dehydrogenase family protein [Alphaproteobacteria bacterium]|nr:acyl-CoA dehydrogenase family protein [Alphaproteobacteria bacterium]
MPDTTLPQENPKLEDWIARDARGENFFTVDRGLQDGLNQYMDGQSLLALWPHLEELGEVAGNELDRLSDLAEKHPPILHYRDRYGREEQWIEQHPAYREMERIAYQRFGIHRAAHAAGQFGRDRPWPPLAKYAMQYLFVQGEFGLMCPISMTDSGWSLIEAFASDEIREKLRPHVLADNVDDLWRCAHLMTEKGAGSDVGNLETTARQADDGAWRIYGDKWFCSNPDAEVILLLARPEGSASGTRGLSMFYVPKWKADGSRNDYRIMRLKEKLGTRGMPSGEVVLDGAEAHLIGEEGNGIKQIMRTVNFSRLSHGVRAAAMMRRCWNEAKAAAESRVVFGTTIADFPLMRRQLMKILVPTEQALSAFLFSGWVMELENQGDSRAKQAVRLITPIFKFRACRDNVPVATGAMEVRGGNGYIEDWINPRLVRDAHVGLLWEGTSNINALDVVTRAVPKEDAHIALRDILQERILAATAMPSAFRERLEAQVNRAVDFAGKVAASGSNERYARLAAGALYHAMTAALLAVEGATAGAETVGDARRLLLSRMVIEHRLAAQDPLAMSDSAFEEAAEALLLSESPVSLSEAQRVLAL